MKILVYINVLFFSLPGYSQNLIDSIMSKASCECFSRIGAPNKNQNTFTECVLKSIGKDSLLVYEECKRIYGDTTIENYEKFGTDFYQRNSVKLVFTCNAYFTLFDTIRYSQLNNLNKDSIRNQIQLMNKTDTTTWNHQFLSTRGMFHFALSDYDLALNDFNSSLSQDPTNTRALFFKAFLFETQKKYDEAIALYNELALLTKAIEFKIFAAIVERKKNSL